VGQARTAFSAVVHVDGASQSIGGDIDGSVLRIFALHAGKNEGSERVGSFSIGV
jgi:hypothetical protein